METKNGDAYCERIRNQVGMEKAFYVEPVGRSGGMALWWNEDTDVQILFANQQIIDTKVQMKNEYVPICMTWIHADTDEQRRNQNWDVLRDINRNRRGIWACQGDFNAITGHHEKEGGRRQSQRQIDAFNQLIDDIGMEDLGSNGQRFT